MAAGRFGASGHVIAASRRTKRAQTDASRARVRVTAVIIAATPC
jgi:hypothetical protein